MPVTPCREFPVARNAEHTSEEVRNNSFSLPCRHSSLHLRRLTTVSLLQVVSLLQDLNRLGNVRRQRDSNSVNAYFDRVALLDGCRANVDFTFAAAQGLGGGFQRAFAWRLALGSD
jgi:hypothetical protein